MTFARTRFALAVLALALGLATAPSALRAQHPARHVENQVVYEIASQLRCVVCQNLSVADSPSEMASQMRGLIKERLAAGDQPEQVVRYFVDKYGEWVLLSPPRRGFTLLVWVVPAIAVLVGFGIVALLLRRWTRRPAVSAPPPPVDPAMSERIRREMETEA
jgi:cytochrome c-type biogenesis protein CcmH